MLLKLAVKSVHLCVECVKVQNQVCVCHVGNLISRAREPSLSNWEIFEPRTFRHWTLLHLFISMSS